MFCRLLSNFEHCEGKLVAVGDIVAEEERIKENFSRPASSSWLGRLIKEIWGERVRVVKRGSQKGRQKYYLGLTRKSSTSSHHSIDGNQRISQLKTGWHLVSEHAEQLSFARYEPWSFNNQRGVVLKAGMPECRKSRPGNPKTRNDFSRKQKS